MGISKLIDFRALRESSFGGKGAVKVIDHKYGQSEVTWVFLKQVLRQSFGACNLFERILKKQV